MDQKLQLIIETIQRGEQNFQEIKKQLSGVEDGLKGVNKASGEATNVVGSLESAFMKLITVVGGLAIIKKVVTESLSFLGQLETSTLGIGAAFMLNGKYIDQQTGKAVNAQQALALAQQDAKAMMEELQVANFQTIATLDQLVRAFQETLPVAMSKGFNREQVKEFTVAVVQAAGAIGLSLDMLAEETRSLLQGTINPRTSRIGVVLGLTNEDIRQNSQSAQQLFD